MTGICFRVTLPDCAAVVAENLLGGDDVNIREHRSHLDHRFGHLHSPGGRAWVGTFAKSRTSLSGAASGSFEVINANDVYTRWCQAFVLRPKSTGFPRERRRQE